jgi:hypothetical protein
MFEYRESVDTGLLRQMTLERMRYEKALYAPAITGSTP